MKVPLLHCRYHYEKVSDVGHPFEKTRRDSPKVFIDEVAGGEDVYNVCRLERIIIINY